MIVLISNSFIAVRWLIDWVLGWLLLLPVGCHCRPPRRVECQVNCGFVAHVVTPGLPGSPLRAAWRSRSCPRPRYPPTHCPRRQSLSAKLLLPFFPRAKIFPIRVSSSWTSTTFSGSKNLSHWLIKTSHVEVTVMGLPISILVIYIRTDNNNGRSPSLLLVSVSDSCVEPDLRTGIV